MSFTSPVCYATETDLSTSVTTPHSSTSQPIALSVSISPTHTFSKFPQTSIRLLTGLGIEGDAHMGTTTQHLYAMARKPEQENLRQVHLMSSEFLESLVKDPQEGGGRVVPGEMGENITTQGIEILDLTKDTVLEFVDPDTQIEGGRDGEGEVDKKEWARIRIQGLRNPCSLIEKHGKGLQAQCMEKDGWRVTKRKAGIMATVERGGVVRPGMRIVVVEEGSEPLKVV